MGWIEMISMITQVKQFHIGTNFVEPINFLTRWQLNVLILFILINSYCVILQFFLVPMIFTSLVVSGLTLSKTCWELEDVNIRSNKFPEVRHSSWWSNLLIGCSWRFFALTSQVFSIVVFLIFFWLHFLYKTQLGSFKYDTSKIENIFSTSNASIYNNEVLKEESMDKYYVYIIPVAIFFCHS